MYRVSRRLDPIEPLNDRRLKWDEIGLMAYLLSKPAGFEISHQELVDRTPDGRDKVARIKRGLIEKGYLEVTREQNEDGTFYWVTLVYESPALNNTYVERVCANVLDEQSDDFISKNEDGTITGLTIYGKSGYGQEISDSLDSLRTGTGRQKPVEDNLPVPADLSTSYANPRGLAPQAGAGAGARTLSEKNEVRAGLEDEFRKRTDLEPPENAKSAGALWWKPLRSIANLVEWHEDQGRWLIAESVKRMRGATIKSPKSILSTARSIARELATIEPEEYTPLGGKGEDKKPWTPL